jgi:hypothetical protein
MLIVKKLEIEEDENYEEQYKRWIETELINENLQFNSGYKPTTS